MGSLSDAFRDMQFKKQYHVDKCPHPGCPIPKREAPPSTKRCDCPTMLVIPAGEHHHHTCPVHGEVVMHGSSIRMRSTSGGDDHGLGCH